MAFWTHRPEEAWVPVLVFPREKARPSPFLVGLATLTSEVDFSFRTMIDEMSVP